MPSGSLWKQKRPKGVVKVVSNAESGDKGTCQKPELVSSLEKMVAPDTEQEPGRPMGEDVVLGKCCR